MKRVGLAAAVAALLLVASSAQAATPAIDIHSAGPLSDIYIGNDLSCQVRSGGFSSTEFFPNASGPGDCGTFLFITGSDSVHSELLGPDFANHAGGTHTTASPTPRCRSRPCSQSLTGVGHRDRVRTGLRPSSPLTTRSERGPSIVLTFTEVDTYVVGQQLLPDRRHGREHWARGAERQRRAVPRCRLPAARQRQRVSARSSHQLGADHGRRAPARRSATTMVLEEFVPITAGSSWEPKQRPRRYGQTLERKRPAQLDASVCASNCRQRDGDRVARLRPCRRRSSADLLVPDDDRRHRPRWRLLVRRPCGLSRRRDRRHHHRPEHKRHPERVFGDDQLGRRQFLGGHRRRRQRQLLGDREPQLPGRRNVPHHRDDHGGRHQPRQLYRERLRHDHGPSVHRDHGRPDRQQQHEGRFCWIRQSGRPPHHDALRVRARLAL